MSLWWLQPGWTDATCSCGARIWPEGDPDWGCCWTCMSANQEQQDYAEYERQLADQEAATMTPPDPETGTRT